MKKLSDKERVRRIKARGAAQNHALVTLARRYKSEYDALYRAALQANLAKGRRS